MPATPSTFGALSVRHNPSSSPLLLQDDRGTAGAGDTKMVDRGEGPVEHGWRHLRSPPDSLTSLRRQFSSATAFFSARLDAFPASRSCTQVAQHRVTSEVCRHAKTPEGPIQTYSLKRSVA